MIDLGLSHGIIIFCLPPHTTHKLQPLDVGVFGPFSCAWADQCDEIVEEYGKEMRREDFVKEYMQVRSAAFKKTTICSSFTKSGLWPINPEIFKSTTTGHVPPSYPNATLPPGESIYDTDSDDDETEEVAGLTSKDPTRDSDQEDKDDDSDEDKDVTREDQPLTRIIPVSEEHALSVISDPFGLLSGIDSIVQQTVPLSGSMALTSNGSSTISITSETGPSADLLEKHPQLRRSARLTCPNQLESTVTGTSSNEINSWALNPVFQN